MHHHDAALSARPSHMSTAPLSSARRLRTLLLGSVAIFGAGHMLAPSTAFAFGGSCAYSYAVPGTTAVDCTGTFPSAISIMVVGPQNLDITSSATITATGSNVPGILGESAGGNGTNGTGGATGSRGFYYTAGGDGTIGTNGTSGGSGGLVSITQTGTITTSGPTTTGILARSKGGSGGAGGTGGNGGEGAPFGQGVGGRGGNGGDGGAGGSSRDITVRSNATITTSDADAIGIFASSVGGEGGNGGAPGRGGYAESGPNGDGTNGSHGSAGNGGNGGNSGVVSVTTSADISATGANGIGIAAVSRGGTGGTGGSGFGVGSGTAGANGTSGDVFVTINGGTVTGGSGYDGTGVYLDAGSIGRLTNSGTITALSGNAIEARGNNIRVTNTGKIIGNVTMVGQTTGFINVDTGVFESGDTINLGSNGDFSNTGTLSPGGRGTVQTTTLTGSYGQYNPAHGAEATYLVDADWTGNGGAGSADKLVVSGSAELEGKVVVNPLNFPSSNNAANSGLNKTFNILTAVGVITDNGITVVDTAAVDYSLQVGPHDVDLKASINFLGAGGGGGIRTGTLTGNQTSVGKTLNKIVSGGSTLGFIAPLMTVPSQGELGDALDQLAPAGDGGSFSSALSTGATFGGQLLSCRTAGEQGDGSAFIHEGQCVWARANARHLDNDGGDNKVGFDETATFFSGGGQFDLGGDWRLGAGLGFENTNLQTSSNATADGERLHLGAVLKYNPGPWLLAASVTGGHGWSDNERNVSFGGFNATAKSDTDTSFFGGRFTAAYLASFGNWYLKPQVDVAATHLSRDGYTESGSGGIALSVRGSDDTVVSVSPMLELGAQFAIAGGGIARPFVKGGVTWLDTDTFTTTAGFADAGAGIAPFAITTEIDDVVADVGAGVDFISTSGTVLRLQYDGQFGDLSTQHGGTAKVSVPF